MSTEKKFSFESLQDSTSIRKFLEALTQGIEKGTIHLSSNEGSIDMIPNGLLNFSVKAKKKGHENKIALKIVWNDKKIRTDGITISTGS